LIEDQYGVAADFLASLTDQLLGGDRHRIILIPGNHDIDWNMARNAMGMVSDDKLPSRIGAFTFASSADLRWSWSERQVYRIDDRGQYEDRLLAFRKFYYEFYRDTTWRLAQDLRGYFDLFELCEGRIAVAAFNSCYGNDCYCVAGHIPDDAIANAHLILRDQAPAAELLMAVWHHNVEGLPSVGDYMDLDSVHRMIGVGFRLGLHGHQHRAQLGHRYVLLPEEERMAVVSAGSLCAGRTDLPTGVNRQYNLIQLGDSLSRARVHIREMVVATVFGPAMRADLGGKGYVDLTWESNSFRRHVDRASASGTASLVAAAESAWKAGRIDEARETLMRLPNPSGYARSLFVHVLEGAEDWDLLVRLLDHPIDIAELTLLVRAHVERGAFGLSREALDRWGGQLSLPPPQRQDLEHFINAREALETE